LPPPHGKFYVQGLVDHFFIDIEDRIRAVLQPPKRKPREPYTFDSPFYINPNAPAMGPDGKPVRRSRASDRDVTRQMHIFREQWQGLTQSMDLAVVQGDMEMAATVWRNFLGARGARGIEYPGSSSGAPRFRRSVNLTGSIVQKMEKINLEEEEAKDDGSGVHDYTPEEADKYVKYPELMVDTVTYIRRELVRLESISDEEIMEGDWKKLLFGRVRQ
jgi:cytochrome b pre-mRNA-processing protein 3